MAVQDNFRYISKAVPRVEGRALAMGAPFYMDDSAPESCLLIRVIRSPYPLAEVEEYDDAAAKQVPGVVRIFNWEDTTNRCTTGYTYSPLEHTLLKRVARYEGDAVAMVVAETQKAADTAAGLIRIKWKVGAPLMDMRKSFRSGFLVHGDQMDQLIPDDSSAERSYRPEENQINCAHYEFGLPVDEVMADCEAVASARCTTSQQMHAMLETHRCYAYLDERDILTLVGPMQAIYGIQDTVALLLNLDKRKIRTVKTAVGGGFGGKNVFAPYLFPAFATHMLKRPTKYIMTREESMACTGTRHEYALDVTLGADRDGVIRAVDCSGLMNGGAYSEFSYEVMLTGIFNTYPIFPRVDAIRIDQRAVFTNKVLGCAFRGFGATQNSFALNCAPRHLADILHMDLSELFLKNIVRAGDSHPLMNGYLPEDPAVVYSAALDQCIVRAKEMIGWEHKRNRTPPAGSIVRGVVIGIGANASGVPRDDRAAVNLTFNPDGSFSIFSGHSDIGTGSNTAMIQIVAEVLKVPMDIIRITAADSAFTPFDNGTYASSNLYRACGAAKLAAEKLKAMLLQSAREYLGLPPDAPLTLSHDAIRGADGKPLIDLVSFAGKMISYWHGREQLVASASFPVTFAPSPYVASCLEIEIDKETGCYQVKKVATVVDSGRIINLNSARVQLQGGIVQSLGMAMFEQVQYAGDGRLLTKDYENYKIPSQMDVPDLEVEFADSFEPTGPFGAKSIGEIATSSPAPALCDAIFNATGVHIDSIPVTPEKLLWAIRAKESGEAAP
jgi:CO/xanthine dehydrogenase Mo-binding subunit